MITTVRVQEKGQVTIPREIRRRLNLKKGDLVTFISTENGIVIKTLDSAADDLLVILRNSLISRGIQVDQVLTRARTTGADQLANEFNLNLRRTQFAIPNTSTSSTGSRGINSTNR